MQISKILITGLFLFNNFLSANAADVFGKDNHFIKVTFDKKNQAAAFELCSLTKANCCSPIGAYDSNQKPLFYKLTDLRRQHAVETREIYYSAGGDILALIGAAYLGAYAGLAIAPSGAIEETLFISAGTTAGGISGLAVSWATKTLNPFAQYQDARIIKDDVINDKTVNLKNDSMVEYSLILNDVLKNLKPIKN